MSVNMQEWIEMNVNVEVYKIWNVKYYGILQVYYNLSKLCYIIFIQISVLYEHVINIPFFYIIIYTEATRNICILFYLF